MASLARVAEQDVCPHLSQQFQTLVSRHFLAVSDVRTHLSGTAEVHTCLIRLPFRRSPPAPRWVDGWNQVCQSSSGQALSCRKSQWRAKVTSNLSTSYLKPFCYRLWRRRKQLTYGSDTCAGWGRWLFQAKPFLLITEPWSRLCHYCILNCTLGL